jgi:hypothetical protein
VGQFGLIGLALMAAVMLVAPVLTLIRSGAGGTIGAVSIVVMLAAVDAAMNSFIFWPAIIAAGALANYRPEPPNAVDNPDRPLSMPRRSA